MMNCHRFYDASVIGNKMYFAEAGHNGLYSYDFETKETIKIDEFKCAKSYEHDLYHQVVEWEDKLIFIPYFAKDVSVYNLLNPKLEYYELLEPNIHGIAKALLWENKLLMIPIHDLDYVGFWDLRKNRFEHDNELSNVIKTCIGDPKGHGLIFDINSALINGETLYLSVFRSDIIISINLKTYESSFVRVENSEFDNICEYNNRLWLVEFNNSIVTSLDMNLEKKEIYRVGNQHSGRVFFGTKNIGGNLYLLPMESDIVFKYDETIDDFLPIYDISKKEEHIRLAAPYVNYVQLQKDKFLLSPIGVDEAILIDDTNFSDMKFVYSRATLERKKEIIRENIRHGEPIYETYMDLNEYIEGIQ